MGYVVSFFILVLIFFMIRCRNRQPLKKKSAWLMTISTIGNLLCFINITVCMYTFEIYKYIVMDAFYQSLLNPGDTYDKFVLPNSENLMKNLIDIRIGPNLMLFTNINGLMVMSLSEPLALFPYILRSIRLSKIFKAREIYCEEGKIPKQMIWNWIERRIIKLMLAGLTFWFMFVVLYSLLSYSFDVDNRKFIYSESVIPNYNSLSYIL